MAAPRRLTANSASPPILLSGGGSLYGWAFKETTGNTAASFDILDGETANGNLMVPIALTGGQSTRDWFTVRPMPIYQGVFLNVISGTFEGVVWFEPGDPEAEHHIGIVLTVPLTHVALDGS